MTLDALKEVLQDRIDMLLAEYEPMTDVPSSEQNRWQAGYLEGRLEELRVCLRLVESLKLDEEHPLLELSEKGVRRVDEPIPDEWGSQPRGDWPNSTYGGADVLS